MTVKSKDFFLSLRFCSFYETTKMSFYDLRFRSKQFPDGSLKKVFQAATFDLIFLIDEILADFDLGQLYNMCLMSKFLQHRKPIIGSVSRRGQIP